MVTLALVTLRIASTVAGEAIRSGIEPATADHDARNDGPSDVPHAGPARASIDVANDANDPPTGDCRVCAARHVELTACPGRARVPCGVEGLYSLRADWRCGGSPDLAPAETPPARQVEVALDSRAEVGYAVVLDNTRTFLGRLLCHAGNEADCARFPAAAPCPLRVVRENGMCIFADAAGPSAWQAGGDRGGSLVLTFGWDAPRWEACRGLDRGVRADAAARARQVAHRDFLIPSRGLFRAKRSQQVPVRVTSRTGRSSFFMAFTVIVDSIAHPETLRPGEVSAALAAKCKDLTQLVAAVFHQDRPSRRWDTLRLKNNKDEAKAAILRFDAMREKDKALWKRGRQSAAAKAAIMRAPAFDALRLEDADEGPGLNRTLLRAVLLGYGADARRQEGTPLGTVFAAGAYADDDRAKAQVLRQIRGKRGPTRGEAGKKAARDAEKMARKMGLMPDPSPPPEVTPEVQGGLLRHAGECLAATGLRVVDISVMNALHAAKDHELRPLVPVPLEGDLAEKLWPSEKASPRPANDNLYHNSPETPLKWEGWSGMSGLATGWARVNLTMYKGGLLLPSDEEEREEAMLDTAGSGGWEGDENGGMGGDTVGGWFSGPGSATHGARREEGGEVDLGDGRRQHRRRARRSILDTSRTPDDGLFGSAAGRLPRESGGVSVMELGEERCDAVFQALGPCEGYGGAGAHGHARHVKRLQPSSPFDTWKIRNTTLAETREVVSHVANSYWRHFSGSFGYLLPAFTIIALLLFLWMVFCTVKRESVAVARRVAWDRAAEDLANARARRANAISGQLQTTRIWSDSIGGTPVMGGSGAVERLAPRRGRML